MKLAIVSGVKAFVSQARENRLALAKRVCEKHGYTVSPAIVKKQTNK